jgi:arylsulfatase A-like enzyme
VLSKVLPALRTMSGPKTDRPNVLILVFDTMSAPHLSLYGYGRETTPNLMRFADKATVYHSHYSEGSFTTPGTASILTGLLPWHHRAINLNGLIRRDLVDNNLFRMAGGEYCKIGFSQNLWADLFLRQFNSDLDLHMPASSFAYNNPLLLGENALSDPLPYLAYDDFLVGGPKVDTPYSGSVMLGMLSVAIEHGLRLNPELVRKDEKKSSFNGYFYYQNRTVFQGIYETLRQIVLTEKRPYLGYFHLWSPHEPYSPLDEFTDLFQENLKTPRKPKHPLVDVAVSERELRQYRRVYDQYIANVDAEFGILMEALKDSGLLDNTCVIVLSDHGQLFERGVHGHGSRLMYDAGIHIPLLISAPGQTNRVDVYEPTGNVDLLPTLATIMGVQPPARLDGYPLPGLGGIASVDRSLFSIQAKESSAFDSLSRGTFTLIKGTRKLIMYTGYPGYEDTVELYDLKEDLDEMRDLSSTDPVVTKQMKEELLAARHAADQMSVGNAVSGAE